MSKRGKKWFNSLSTKQKDNFIGSKNVKKRESRCRKEEAESAQVVKRLGAGKVCAVCFHLKTNSCKGLSDIRTKVCRYFQEIPHI